MSINAKLLPAVTAILAVLGTAASADAAGPITIGDGTGPATPYPSVIERTDAGQIVEDVDVRISNLVHEFPDELDILLAGPGGQTVMLTSDRGAGGVSCGSGAADLRFRSGATSPVPESELPCGGTYMPTDDDTDSFDFDAFPAPAPVEPFGASLAAFNGSYAAGAWKLYVVDDTYADGGSIAAWSLSLRTRGPAHVRFGSSVATAREAEATASPTLRRSGGSAEAPLLAASVTWVAEPCGAPLPPEQPLAPATPEQDFSPAQGTVTFGPGEAEKTLDVGIVDDRLPEGTECFALRLASATGDAALDSSPRLVSRVKIVNDDPRASTPVVSSRGKQRVLRRKAVVVTARSRSDGTLSATGAILLPRKSAASVRLKPAARSVTSGETVTLKLRLSRKGLRAVRRAFKSRRALVARITVRATDLAGGRASNTVRLRLPRG